MLGVEDTVIDGVTLILGVADTVIEGVTLMLGVVDTVTDGVTDTLGVGDTEGSAPNIENPPLLDRFTNVNVPVLFVFSNCIGMCKNKYAKLSLLLRWFFLILFEHLSHLL